MKAASVRAGSIKKWALAIAIAIVFNLFVNYGLATFYREPKYDAYCNSSYYPRKPVPAFPAYPEAGKSCPSDIIASEQEYQNCSAMKGYIQYRYGDDGCPESYYCETCGAAYDAARNKYDGNAFFILVIIGVAAVVAGVLIPVEAVGSGFLLGGIISILIGTVRNWSNLTDVLRFIILGVILAILIIIGYKKLRD